MTFMSRPAALYSLPVCDYYCLRATHHRVWLTTRSDTLLCPEHRFPSRCRSRLLTKSPASAIGNGALDTQCPGGAGGYQTE